MIIAFMGKLCYYEDILETREVTTKSPSICQKQPYYGTKNEKH